MSAVFLMTDPGEYAVSYRINPWMRPAAWAAGPELLRRRARVASNALAAALRGLGAAVTWTPAAPGLPDLVFPANAAVVLDGRALMARFKCPERQGEETVFAGAFHRLRRDGVVSEVSTLPPGCFQEGAGDAIWDRNRGWFWTGYGQRSVREASDRVADFFGRPAVALELATPRYYHLDTCFCPLAGGEVIYYPPAFTPASLAAIRERVVADLLIEATDEDAAAFCVNAVSLGRDIVMAKAPPALTRRLRDRGYRVSQIDLSPFLLSGGAAFCMTLRLDLQSAAAKEIRNDHRHAAARALA